MVGRVSVDHRGSGLAGCTCRHPDAAQWSLRWILLHMIEETAVTPAMPTSSASRSTAQIGV